MPSASAARIAANRANAQRSTGPRTAAGKQRSRLNAIRHGLTAQTVILPAEDLAAFTAFCSGIAANLYPEGPLEQQLAERIAQAQWRLNRVAAIEDNLMALAQIESPEASGTETAIAAMEIDNPEVAAALRTARWFSDNTKVFLNLSLYEQRIQRTFEQNLKLLRDLQSVRRANAALTRPIQADPANRTAPPTPAKSKSSATVGFVFPKSAVALESARETLTTTARNPIYAPGQPTLALTEAA